MAATTRVFVAQLTGLPVFGPDGERIGKLRDVVAGLRVSGAAPRILGIVVEMVTRRRIFVPMLRVTRIEATEITLATGSVSLSAFRRRPNEVLVLGQLLDAHVRLPARDSGSGVPDSTAEVDAPAATTDDRHGRGVVVTDAAMERTRTRDWVLARLAVRDRTGRLGRRGPVRVVRWEDADGLRAAQLDEQPQGAQRLLATYETMRAVDIATSLHGLPEKRRHEVAEALDDERLADVIEELPEDDQKHLLTALEEERAADVLEAMNPDDAADLLGELPELDKDRFLALMEPEESAPVKRLLAYSADTAGGLMTPDPIVLGPDATVAEALARVRYPDITPALASMVFVTRPPAATPTGRYLGCVHAQRLLRDPPYALVAGALDTDLPGLPPDAPLAEVARYFAAYNLVCGPVTDDEDHLLGAVAVDDVLDHLLPENWREEGLHRPEVHRA